MTRTRIALTVTSLGLAGLLGLSGCGAGISPAAAADEAALTAVGLERDPAPSASAGRKQPGVRKYLRKNTLHGEITVQGKDKVRTVVVQRGTVTAVDATSMSVKSADGFVLSWSLGEKLRVKRDKKTVEVSAITTGAQVGVAGGKEGATSVARLVIVR